MKYGVLLGSSKWAQYVNEDVESQASFTEKALKCLPNKLTPLYSKIYYEEENYLKVKTKLFIYLFPPYNKGLSILQLQYISIFYILSMQRSHISKLIYSEFCYVI